jgi:4-amino-4-deoxy-L-arabinose transferase-like glycosyltransferase
MPPYFAGNLSRMTLIHWLRVNAALLVILAAAVGLRLAAGAWWQSRLPPGDKFGFGDSDSYWALGRTIADGKSYQYGDAQVFRTPGYPLVLAPLFWIGGDEPPPGWGFAESAVLGTAAVGGVYWLARNLFDRRAALIAAGIAAVYPGAISQGALVLSEAPFVPLALVQLALWGLASRSKSRRRTIWLSLATGIVAGLATLMRPSWLLFTPLAVVVAMVTSRDRKRSLILSMTTITGLIVAMLPWWIRNDHVTGHFVPTTLQVGASLYDGVRPGADGSSNMAFVETLSADQRVRDSIANPPLPPETFEYRLDQRMFESATVFVVNNPSRALNLAVTKFLRTWNIWPNEPGLRAWPLRLAVSATYVPLVILGIWGAIRFSKRGWPYVLCWLPVPYFALLHMVFVGSIRYREPAMIALIPLAAGLLSEWWENWHAQRALP